MLVPPLRMSLETLLPGSLEGPGTRLATGTPRVRSAQGEPHPVTGRVRSVQLLTRSQHVPDLAGYRAESDPSFDTTFVSARVPDILSSVGSSLPLDEKVPLERSPSPLCGRKLLPHPKTVCVLCSLRSSLTDKTRRGTLLGLITWHRDSGSVYCPGIQDGTPDPISV